MANNNSQCYKKQRPFDDKMELIQTASHFFAHPTGDQLMKLKRCKNLSDNAVNKAAKKCRP